MTSQPARQCDLITVFNFSIFDRNLFLQDYKQNTPFRMGTQRTGSLLYLNVANTTYVPQSPDMADMRVSERSIVKEFSAACGDPCHPSRMSHQHCHH